LLSVDDIPSEPNTGEPGNGEGLDHLIAFPDYLVIETAFTVVQWIIVAPLTALISVAEESARPPLRHKHLVRRPPPAIVKVDEARADTAVGADIAHRSQPD
jgi:hypothetical protein